MQKTGIMILAAGQGKRMRSAMPKVLHEIGGQPMLFHILDRVLGQTSLSPDLVSVGIVVGHGRAEVEAAVGAEARFKALNLSFIYQSEQRGTGHAAKCAMESRWGDALVSAKGSVLVLPGDLPLIPSELVLEMMAPLGRSEVLKLLTCELADPTGYGRIVRRGRQGPVLRIVEEKDATGREKQIREVGASIYHFQAGFLRYSLEKLSNKNAQGEYYLTDLIAHAARAKKRVHVVRWPDPEDLRGVNDAWELAQARKILNQRQIRHWAQRGAKFIDADHVWMDVTVELAEDVTVYPGAVLQGKTRVAGGTVLGPNVVLKDARIGSGVTIKAGSVIDSSSVERGCQIGPYAHLRPESVVGPDCKIGNFVELKKAKIGAHTSVAHLSYIGDAEVGSRVNIGCGFVTCNFDGRVIDGERKHRTVIEDEVFIGSDCQTVAPVRVGKGAYIASGSTITQSVEPDALAIARARQVNKAGYARKLRAEAAGSVTPGAIAVAERK